MWKPTTVQHRFYTMMLWHTMCVLVYNATIQSFMIADPLTPLIGLQAYQRR